MIAVRRTPAPALRRGHVYPHACPRCGGALHVDTHDARVLCINCGRQAPIQQKLRHLRR